MSGRTSVRQQTEHFELCFPSLHGEDQSLSFPCDADGHVDMDALSEAGRQRYFYARAVVGREFSQPAVKRASADGGECDAWEAGH